jgi:hypothetical protein
MEHALKPNGDEPPYDWVLQIDADAAPIPHDIVLALLYDAYVLAPEADVVGAYCQLKTPPHLPTIDTGTGTWEIHFPGGGLLPVMRTGGHCLLVKTPILTRFGPPWFSTRRSMRPMDALHEIDNYARCKLDGENPLQETDAWKELVDHVKAEPGANHHVGEDSGFCDAVKAVGGTILVDTNLVVGHVGKKIYSPIDLRDAVAERKANNLLGCGIY